MTGKDSSFGDGYRDTEFDPPCEGVQFQAQLTSPQPKGIESIEVDDILEITVADMNGKIVVQVLNKDQVVGGLAGPDATKLRNCIDKGHQYKATVRTINGGQVRVHVEHI